MSRTFLTFGDIAGKVHRLRIECTRCPRKGCYNLSKLMAQHGHRGNMSKWVSDLGGARGWYLQDKGQQQAMAQATQNGFQALMEERRQLCAREDLQPHYRKTPCEPEDATFEQVTDSLE